MAAGTINETTAISAKSAIHYGAKATARSGAGGIRTCS